MGAKPEVYKLEMFEEGPFAEDGFAFVDRTSITGRRSIYADFLPVYPLERNWKAPRLAEVWKPREVIGTARPDNDFPWLGVDLPGFRQRAVNGLRELLEPNGELLALKTPPGVGRCWAYHITTIVDALDEGHSLLQLYPNSSWEARRIERHEFIAERVAPLSIFRVVNSTLDVYATNSFVERVAELGLHGLRAIKVWPLPPRADWYELAREESRKLARAVAKEAPGKVRRRAKTYASRAPAGAELSSLMQSISQYPGELKLDVSKMTPDQVQDSIHDSIEQLRASGQEEDRLKDRAFWLAIAWGESVVRSLGWQWVILEDCRGASSVAVASPDRSIAVVPVQFIERIATDPKADPSSQLLFNMIRAGKVPKAAAGKLKLLG